MAVSINIGANANPVGLTCWSAKRRRSSAALPCPCANVVLICHINAARKFCAADGRRLSSDCALRPSRSPETALFHVGMLLALQKFATDGQHVCVVPQRSKKASNIPNARGDYPMKANQLLTICGIAAALFLSAGSVSAQNDNGGGGGGGRRGGGGNFDPAQMQQRIHGARA